jgi:hypothetical protein
MTTRIFPSWIRAALLFAALGCPLPPCVNAADPAPAKVYENDFERADLDKLPPDFLLLEGGFAVKADGTNRVLELPGAPLETFGVMFGPSAKSEFAVQARIRGTSKGRRFPSFGVGLGGASGFRLQVSPAKKTIELLKADEMLATSSFAWTSGEWTQLRLRISQAAAGQWRIQGKAWPSDQPEPTAWPVEATQTQEPTGGRAAIWGSPFAGTPIQFDDLVVWRWAPTKP